MAKNTVKCPPTKDKIIPLYAETTDFINSGKRASLILPLYMLGKELIQDERSL
jgi:hypothetical protein